MNYRYDAHCHIFTAEYVIQEIKSLAHDIWQGIYPWHDPKARDLARGVFLSRHSLHDEKIRGVHEVKGIISDINRIFRQLIEVLKAAEGTEEENLNFLQREAKKAFPSEGARIIPLMMDIFYVLAYPLDKNSDISDPKFASFSHEHKVEHESIFQEIWDEILDDFTQHVQFAKTKEIQVDRAVSDNKFDQLLKAVEKHRPIDFIHESTKSALDAMPNVRFHKTNGFCLHLDNLKKLVKNRTNELFPFIAIDPRRPGIIEELLSGSFFEGDGRFYGVKLYPRLGYHPQCKPLDAVYEYCSKNNLPITFHCGKSGFPPGTDWKYAEFGNPLNFEPIVKKYPNLKIDFAHLGSADPSLEWAKTIVRLVNENENVYSDLSCYTSKDDLKKIKELWNTNPKLKKRMMFGTDFDVMYLTDFVTMQDYYNNFKEFFSEADLNVMMQDNPSRFLGVDEPNLRTSASENQIPQPL